MSRHVYGGFEFGGAKKLVAINNIELISDRPLDVNLREIAEVKKLWPDRAVIVSAMFRVRPESLGGTAGSTHRGHRRGRHRA